ncbi:MAG: hypothetical protein R2745_23820 [Vicinamibacterales bacterium]
MTTPSASRVETVVAWLGALGAAAALGYAAWFYYAVVDEPGPPRASVAGAVLWNVGTFTLFAVHHSVMVRTGLRERWQQVVSPRLERSSYVWIASALLALVCATWRRVPGVLYSAAPPLSWLLLGLQASGVALSLAGARVLDARELAGIRQATGHATPTRIRVVWPFTMVRHPIYLGWVLIVFGASPMTVDRAVAAVVSTAYLLIAMPWEERSLAAAAGPAYSAYCRQVRWRLVPGLY